MTDTTPRADLGTFFDAEWYRAEYPDVATAGIDPLDHFLNHGMAEARNPNAFFDSAWYLEQYPDVARAGIHPLLHYMQHGASELRNPHPRFDAAFYAEEHPEAAANPLLHHVLVGAGQDWPTEKRVAIGEYLASGAEPPTCPAGIEVDIVIPVYRGLEQTQRCLASVLADPHRPAGQIILVDDRSPEPELSAWLDTVNATGKIRLIRHRRNLGFVVSVNRGMQVSDRADIVLLNSDTEVPAGWLARLAGHAYAQPRVGTVSPFSNNATICSYPHEQGGPMPFGLSLAEVDAACREANGGRTVDVPTTVGFAMYIRRACLDEIGLFDAETFGRGYGEENDFCMRAGAAGWRNLLACDTFVYHEGNVSFGAGSSDLDGKSDLLLGKHPNFNELVAKHIRRDQVGPYRLALTAALFRRSGRPSVLMVTHGLGGGVRQQLNAVMARTGGHGNFFELSATKQGVALSVPAREEHPPMLLGEDRLDDLVRFLRSAAVSRVHIHHTLGMRLDLRDLIHRLGVPFDFTVHDFLTICPQINMLPRRDSQYCGAPGPAVCNACIAARPDITVRDILGWRAAHAWLLQQADRVICPSEDTRSKLARYRLDQRAIVVPHEPVGKVNWPMRPPTLQRGRKLRVAILGVLTSHKGLRTVAALAETADPARLEIHLVGYSEVPLPPLAAERIRETGAYQADDLAKLIADVRPHVIWFPGQVPETYSFTLSAAIATGLPIVASRVGAFPERLDGRPLTWLVDPAAPTAEWLERFDEVRQDLTTRRTPPRAKARTPVPDFYADSYLRHDRPPLVASPGTAGVIDLRRPGRTTVVVIPERLGEETISPCGYIRLLQPLDHPAIGGELDTIVADAKEALRYRGDIVACQRYSVANLVLADRLVEHCRRQEMPLLYDLDDNLMEVPSDHADAAVLRPRAEVVNRLVRQADAVWVSTPALRDVVCTMRADAELVPNGLDERLWSAVHHADAAPFAPLRILFMGTATHDADLTLVLPALRRLHEDHGEHVRVDVLGVTGRALPEFVNRVALPPTAAASYPGFVSWITQRNVWDVGIAPLLDTPFNRSKSAIKTMDYAALGLAVLASNLDVYRGSIADGAGGMLVAENAASWYEALSRLLQDWRLLRDLREGARRSFAAYTLAAQADERRRAWSALTAAARRQVAA